MKRWLYLAGLEVLAIGLLDNFILRILLALGLVALNHFIWVKKERIYLLGCLAAMLIFSIPLGNFTASQGKVVRVRENYILVASGMKKVLIYTEDDNVSLDDTVLVNCELSEITTYNNFEVSTFAAWAKGNNIVESGSIDRLSVVKPGISLRKWLYSHNEKYGNAWANMLIFGRGLQEDADCTYLVVSAGLHLSLFFGWINNLLRRRYYQKEALLRTLVIVGVFNIIFPGEYALIRIFLSYFSSYFFEDPHEKAGFRLLGLCFYRPYYVKSMAFLLPMGMMLINLYSQQEHREVSALYMLGIRLYLNGYVDLLETLLFSLWRYVMTVLFCIGLVVSLLPVQLNLNEIMISLLNFIDQFPKVYLDGRMNGIILAIFIAFLLEYQVCYQKIYLVLLLLMIMGNNYASLLCPFNTITYLDIGQGDCAVITFPFSSEALLIDVAGNFYKDNANDIIIPYLRSQSIKSVSVLITHDDYDHNGALADLQANFRVNEVYESKTYQLSIGNLTIYDPVSDIEYEDENDNSQVSYFEIYHHGFLFLGDVSKTVEQEIVKRYADLNVSVVKIAHHGSNTSTSEEMLAQYQLKIAVISAGRNNRYHHPSQETVSLLEKYQVQILNTQSNHGIKLIPIKGLLIYLTSDNQIGIYPE